MIEITDAAAKRIQTAMVDEGRTEGGLRVGIKAGGCNGFSYVFKWEHAPSSDDEVFASPSGARIFVDPKELQVSRRHGAGLRPEHARAVTGGAQSQRHERVWLRPVVRRLAIRGAGHVCHTEGRGDRRQSVPHPALATQAVADARRGIVVVVRALMPESNHFQPSPADRPSRPLVVVSNREPYLHSIGEGGTVTWEPTTGGVAVALDALMRDRGGVWIAHGAGRRRSASSRCGRPGAGAARRAELCPAPDLADRGRRAVLLRRVRQRGTVAAVSRGRTSSRCSVPPIGAPTRRSTSGSRARSRPSCPTWRHRSLSRTIT